MGRRFTHKRISHDSPALTSLVADTWTKVIDTKKGGIISIAGTRPKFYIYDQRDAGDPAPANNNTARQIGFSGQIEISSSIDIDVYVKAVGSAGSVIVEV